MSERHAYSQALSSGQYERTTGLHGKYDNVRRLWEDRVTARFLRPWLNRIAQEREHKGKKLRVLDLGCGGGDGFDLITSVPAAERSVGGHAGTALNEDSLESYVGLDLNEDLLAQARDYLGHKPFTGFLCGDLSNGLPGRVTREEPFDLYFSSYGTYSHFNQDQTVRLLGDIAEHAPDRALIVCDWLGRYANEWQNLWQDPAEGEQFMEYRISYILPEEERNRDDIASFDLRLMSREEILASLEEVAQKTGNRLRPLHIFDRSMLVGRHMDTGEYNPHVKQPMRKLFNSLFEPGVRTDLKALQIAYEPREGFVEANIFHGQLFRACNDLIMFTSSLLNDSIQMSEVGTQAPDALQETMEAMYKAVSGLGWIGWSDVRANLVEPLLGYGLRHLEMALQKGQGMGHGLVGILEVQKS